MSMRHTILWLLLSGLAPDLGLGLSLGLGATRALANEAEDEDDQDEIDNGAVPERAVETETSVPTADLPHVFIQLLTGRSTDLSGRIFDKYKDEVFDKSRAPGEVNWLRVYMPVRREKNGMIHLLNFGYMTGQTRLAKSYETGTLIGKFSATVLEAGWNIAYPLNGKTAWLRPMGGISAGWQHEILELQTGAGSITHKDETRFPFSFILGAQAFPWREKVPQLSLDTLVSFGSMQGACLHLGASYAF